MKKRALCPLSGVHLTIKPFFCCHNCHTLQKDAQNQTKESWKQGEKGVLSCRKQSLWKKKWTKGSEKPPQHTHNLLSHRILHIDCDRCDSKNHKTLVHTYARVREIREKAISHFAIPLITPQKVRTKKQANVCANLYGFFSEKGRFFLEKYQTFSEKHRTFPRKCRTFSEKGRIFSQESALSPQKISHILQQYW